MKQAEFVKSFSTVTFLWHVCEDTEEAATTECGLGE
jgi:hypothetical protein